MRAALLAAVVAVLAAANLTAHFAPEPFKQVAVPVAAVVLLVLARCAGLGWKALGMARADWRRGGRYAVVLAGLILAAIAAGAALPATRADFLNDRYHLGWGPALLAALVLIPLQTVLPEEIAFRGVLYGMLARGYGDGTAIIGSSVLFGLWHITASLGLASGNRGLGGLLGSPGVAVAGTVVFTAAAGVVFCWARLRSGSILASIGLHWAANGAGALAAALAWQLSAR